MIRREMTTLLDDTTLTASHTFNDIDVSSCIGITVKVKCATEEDIGFCVKFAESGTYASPVGLSETHYGTFVVDGTTDKIFLQTIGKENMYIQFFNWSSISDVTVRIEKVIA